MPRRHSSGRRRQLRRTADVRMFSGWAESVLWGVSGPLPYDDLGLPAPLVAELERWDLVWSRAAHPDAPTTAILDRRAHDREGRRLARQVADAFGSALVLELHSERWPRRRRLRGRREATVPAAAALVRRTQDEQAAEQARVQALLAEGAELHWSADPPSGTRDD